MEPNHVSLIDLYPRTTEWLKEFLLAAKMMFHIRTPQEFFVSGSESAAIVVYLDPLRNWSMGFLESTSRTGYKGRIIGWIPGETIPPEQVLALVNRNVHAILPDFYSPEEAAGAIRQCIATGHHYNHMIGDALMHICRKNGSITSSDMTTFLSERETVAVQLRAEGHSAYEIASAMHVSKAAVDKLFFRLYQRTGHRNFFELYAALRKGNPTQFAGGSEDPFPATNSFR